MTAKTTSKNRCFRSIFEGRELIQQESLTRFNRAAAVVRWWRFLFWRPDHWRQRDLPDSFDMPDRLYHGWISGKTLVVCASPHGFNVSM